MYHHLRDFLLQHNSSKILAGNYEVNNFRKFDNYRFMSNEITRLNHYVSRTYVGAFILHGRKALDLWKRDIHIQ